jgi:hypothetical protein
MSFDILEYPIKSWIVDLIDDEKIKSEIFDLLGDPDIDIRYPSIILYNIEDLVTHDEHHLVAKIEKIEKAEDYKFDLKTFAKCNTVTSDLIGILRESNAVLKYIIKHTDEKIVKLFDLDMLKVKLINDMKLELYYEGKDEFIIKKIKELPYYGFKTSLLFKNYDDQDSTYDSDEELKNVLDSLVLNNDNHII